MIAPHKEPVFVRQRSNTILTANMPETQMSAGRGKKFHFPLIKISPKWERWVKAKAELSIREAVKFPTDFAKLEWTIPLKNNSSSTGLNTMPVTDIITNMTSLSFPAIPLGYCMISRCRYTSFQWNGHTAILLLHKALRLK